mgnify:CR=1 FL=1
MLKAGVDEAGCIETRSPQQIIGVVHLISIYAKRLLKQQRYSVAAADRRFCSVWQDENKRSLWLKTGR